MKVLLVVDMLNDFVNPDGELYVEGAEDIVDTVNLLLDKFSKEDRVIYANDAHEEDDVEFDLFPPHAIKGSLGALIHYGIEVRGDGSDDIVEKTQYDAFHTGKLTKILKEWEITDIYICGVATEFCVKAAALSGIGLGFNVFVITDAIKAIDEDEGKTALETLQTIGVKLITSNDV